MKLGAKIYISLMCAAGAIGLVAAVISWHSTQPWRLLAYCLITLIAAGLKVRLPGISGTMSVSYIFVLSSIVEMGLSESIVVSAIANLVQSTYNTQKRPGWIQLAFNTASAVITVSGAYHVYHHGFDASGLVFRMASAGGVYFLLNTVSVSAVLALTEGHSFFAVWKSAYFWAFPYYLVGASFSALISYVTRMFGWELTLLALPVVYVIYHSYNLYLNRLEHEKVYAEQMASLHLRTIEALALAIEAKDQTTGEHLRRVQVFAREIAKELGLDHKQMTALQAASILHDIGKLAVPDYIISKPGRLTPEEFDKMKIHPVVGAEILETISFPYPVVPIVRAHHEKWDGSGYPDGLTGEEIPIGARILTCVDCFDALASDRQYRRALPLAETIEVIRGESGKSFDPRVVEILCRRYRELEDLAWKEPLEEHRKLSRDLKVMRGAEPDAGFEAVRAPVREAAGAFISSIAAARQELQALYEVTQTIGNSLSLTETLSVVATRVGTLVPYDSIAVYLLEEDVLVPSYVNGESYSLFNSLRIPVGQGLSGWVAENHKPILNGNPSVESGYLNNPMKFSVLRSGVAVPLEGMNGCIGVLALYAAERDAFSRDHLRILLAISAKMSLAIENAVSYQRARHQATIDGLTALPNAASLFLHLESEIARAQQSGTVLTVFVFDLDGFKQINDNCGHLAGNRVLQNVAHALKERCREGDYVARMGGDEFVAVLPGCTHDAVATRIAAFEAAIAEAGEPVDSPLGVSIGAATYPQDGSHPDELLAAADRNMYRAKHSRRTGATSTRNLLNLAESLVQSQASETAVEQH